MLRCVTQLKRNLTVERVFTEGMLRILLFLPLLTGCALFPVSEAECRPASWRQVGYDDGYFGSIHQDFRFMQQCRRYGIEVPQSEYLEGWADGYLEWDRRTGMKSTK
jgi:hypothetical protein